MQSEHTILLQVVLGPASLIRYVKERYVADSGQCSSPYAAAELYRLMSHNAPRARRSQSNLRLQCRCTPFVAKCQITLGLDAVVCLS
jgi:hypothetical protein